ncbi:acyl-CoA thioesterase [Clostridium sp. 'White wine YQ']|uniref:acyl-CoA thioesterase n=1 Tax=Clostridium sp. 'White wine YQ' TaxID=3027474 RepID=UPI0023666F5C|nr:thioesterase family protein [Clostridium sp. 'White wine YQ']MDD7794320.1 thioesterase family protein [Clostridium sp. 'White wine YQ']
MYVSETKIVVRYAETDQMGIVHHSNYYIWFEQGRTDYIKGCNMSYSDMEERGILMPLAESSCKYIQGAKYEDELIIKSWVSHLSPVKVVFNYSVIREKDQKEISKGSTVHAFVNKDLRIMNIKKTHSDIYEKLQTLM